MTHSWHTFFHLLRGQPFKHQVDLVRCVVLLVLGPRVLRFVVVGRRQAAATWTEETVNPSEREQSIYPVWEHRHEGTDNEKRDAHILHKLFTRSCQGRVQENPRSSGKHERTDVNKAYDPPHKVRALSIRAFAVAQQRPFRSPVEKDQSNEADHGTQREDGREHETCHKNPQSCHESAGNTFLQRFIHLVQRRLGHARFWFAIKGSEEALDDLRQPHANSERIDDRHNNYKPEDVLHKASIAVPVRVRIQVADQGNHKPHDDIRERQFEHQGRIPSRFREMVLLYHEATKGDRGEGTTEHLPESW
mmetsp:Transcript_36574/g.97499  ORF Transcript_36574/g.97499 Transcript_36574/m.97499 type:complete len:305 (-) Transcript_36574:1374-2288(-)